MEAISLLVKEVPEVRLLLVGHSSQMQKSVIEPMERLGISSHVILAGYRMNDYVDILACMDVFVLLTPGSDGTARALREAMAMKKPVVVTTRGMLPELVRDGVTGFVVQETPQTLYQALLPLVKDKLAEMPEKVTWHDPCVLGRHLDMYEEPRDLLKEIPELELVEMPSSREHALCCGAGGGVYFTCQSMANQAVVTRLEQAVETGANQIVTSCPNCYVRFRQMSRHHRMKIRAKSLAQIINDALG